MHIEPPKITPDFTKLKALVHYVCHIAPDSRKLGATKLNKILFYSDTNAYLERGKPITGETYIKHQYGPISRHVNKALQDLESERAIRIAENTGRYGFETYTIKFYASLRAPSIDCFAPEEINIVDDVVRVICNEHSARSISEASHDIVWKNAEIGEEIPYYTAFAHTLREIEADDIEWARSAIATRT